MPARPKSGKNSGDVRRIAASEIDWSAGQRDLWQEPLCIEGGAADWALAERLTFKRLTADYGSMAVKVARTSNFANRRATTLGEYLRYASRTTERDPYYLTVRVLELDRQLPELIPDLVPFRNWLDLLPVEIRPAMVWLFIGPPRSGTARHQDPLATSAWNALFAGAKRWTFEPPAERQSMRRPASLTCVQRPGDLMFTPATWFHSVVNEQPSIAITGNFLNSSNLKVALASLRAGGRPEWVRMLRHLQDESRQIVAGPSRSKSPGR
jgi:hypothetical protein